MINETVDVDGLALHVRMGGGGDPILLLHGFPETHLAWRDVVPELTDRYTVVCPDLPGYGESASPPDGEGYSKRTTAAIMVRLMATLGHDRFSIIGHDRGALVAFRAALDHPEAVTHVGMIDVIPTVDMWESLRGPGGVFAFHLYLLAQPGDIAERMINADPDTFFGHFFDVWAPEPGTIPDDVRAAYLAAARRPEAVHAVCEDYRASAFIDLHHEADDREAGRRIGQPALAIWQDPGELTLPFDPEKVWQSWASELRTVVLPGGHFLPEARPSEVAEAIRELVG